MVNDGNNDYHIHYEMTERNKKIKKQKVVIVILLIVVLFMLILILKSLIGLIFKTQEYKAQVLAVQEWEKTEIARKEEEERIRQSRIPKLTQEGKDNMANIYTSETKRAFLTFDDGPSTVTPTILDTLKQENIKASFFVLGSRVDALPETVKRIYEEGHYIANHGYSHSYSAIYSSPQSVLDEFNQCNESVKKAIGVPEYNSHLFRFPGGFPGGPYVAIKTQARELLTQNEILYVDWNALSGDAETTKPTVEFEMKRIQETVGSKNSVVILMHDAQAKKATADALPQIISWLKQNGYEFKNFYDIIK